ncbi:MAG: ATP-dependent protease ATPase subunit HslU [Armatimonadetes bacterium]|nr:ATP-dependent protease ATPase subunit HslU [Armatimonadota bacterium]
MEVPIEDLTPKQIVIELDKFIVGQNKAKRAVAVALRNRYRRQLLPPEQREEILPKNILMIGPTGVGKTEIARRLAHLVRAPFVKVEATKFTEVGYVGRDVDSIVRDLVNVSVRMVETEKIGQVREAAEERALERIIDSLGISRRHRRRKEAAQPLERMLREVIGAMDDDEEAEDEGEASRLRRARATVRDQVRSGARDSETIEIEVDEPMSPFFQVFSPQGIEEMSLDSDGATNPFIPRSKTARTVTIGEAKELLSQEEARKMIDRSAVVREAVFRAEQTGIVFLDELDKIAGRERGNGPDVSREGVQRDLLPIIEGATVVTKFGPVRTDHILFIAAGAFHVSKPSDLIPELQGRLPIRVELEDLGQLEFERILREPENALTKQYQRLLGTEGVRLEFTEDGIDEIARFAAEVNRQTENIGARRLHTVMERLMEDIAFAAPDLPSMDITIDGTIVREKIGSVVEDLDLSRYIL